MKMKGRQEGGKGEEGKLSVLKVNKGCRERGAGACCPVVRPAGLSKKIELTSALILPG